MICNSRLSRSAALAPGGFFEIWRILPGVTRLRETTAEHGAALAQGVLNA